MAPKSTGVAGIEMHVSNMGWLDCPMNPLRRYIIIYELFNYGSITFSQTRTNRTQNLHQILYMVSLNMHGKAKASLASIIYFDQPLDLYCSVTVSTLGLQ